MLDAKQDHLRHDVVEIGRAERAGKARLRMIVIADADEVDIAFAVDLTTRKEKDIDASLPRTVEQFARAVSEEGVIAAAKERHVRLAAAALASEERRGRRDRRSGADRDVTHVADQPADHVGEQFFVAESFRRRAAHATTATRSYTYRRK